MQILIPVLVCMGVAAVCAVILTLASVFFGVKEDEKFLAIRDALPGANCGACGFSGCDGYAKALAEGKVKETTLCVPGGAAAAKDIASVLGVESGEVARKVAYVSCNGTCDVVDKKFEYQGVKTCKSATMNYAGDRLCSYACLGYGDCAAVCPEDAIVIKNGVAKVISESCIGCGKCAKTCPNGIIKIINATTKVAVTCSNHDKGAVTRKICTNGCIGCMKCVKTCPNGAISMNENLAVINYDKCTGCGECAKACPVHAIHEDCFVCEEIVCG